MLPCVEINQEANPFVVAYMTGWMDDAAVACYSFHQSADTQWYKLDEGQVLQAARAHWTLEAFRLAYTVPRIVSRVDALLRGSERPAPRGVLPGVGREPGCVTLPDIYIYVQLDP